MLCIFVVYKNLNLKKCKSRAKFPIIEKFHIILNIALKHFVHLNLNNMPTWISYSSSIAFWISYPVPCTSQSYETVTSLFKFTSVCSTSILQKIISSTLQIINRIILDMRYSYRELQVKYTFYKILCFQM